MVWYFIGFYIMYRTFHGRLEISLLVLKKRERVKDSSTLEEKFRISKRSSNILYFVTWYFGLLQIYRCNVVIKIVLKGKAEQHKKEEKLHAVSKSTRAETGTDEVGQNYIIRIGPKRRERKSTWSQSSLLSRSSSFYKLRDSRLSLSFPRAPRTRIPFRVLPV